MNKDEWLLWKIIDRLITNILPACQVLEEEGYSSLPRQLRRDRDALIEWQERVRLMIAATGGGMEGDMKDTAYWIGFDDGYDGRYWNSFDREAESDAWLAYEAGFKAGEAKFMADESTPLNEQLALA